MLHDHQPWPTDVNCYRSHRYGYNKLSEKSKNTDGQRMVPKQYRYLFLDFPTKWALIINAAQDNMVRPVHTLTDVISMSTTQWQDLSLYIGQHECPNTNLYVVKSSGPWTKTLRGHSHAWDHVKHTSESLCRARVSSNSLELKLKTDSIV